MPEAASSFLSLLGYDLLAHNNKTDIVFFSNSPLYIIDLCHSSNSLSCGLPATIPLLHTPLPVPNCVLSRKEIV
jgi:hypothetical protein